MSGDHRSDRKPTRDAEGSIFKRIEERSSANGRKKKITVYYARVRKNEYDDDGNLIRCHELKRQCDTYDDAKIERRKLRAEIDKKIEESKHPVQKKAVRFFDLLDFFEKHYVKEAVWAGKKKIAGQKDPLQNTKRMLDSYREFFGNLPVNRIDYTRIFEYKAVMLATEYPVKRRIDKGPRRRPEEQREYDIEWKTRKPATVHRYLSKLRRIFSVGVSHGMLKSNPFKDGDPLIETSIEETRVRICTYEEELLLYSVCVPPREHLKDIISIAIDLFPRENELFALKGSDIDLENRFAVIQEYNAKTQKERTVPLSNRAFEALQRIRAGKTLEEWMSDRIFGVNNVYRSWYTALDKTEIKDLHFHDLRGTGITRMLDAGLPESIVMKFSGHDKYETFMKYVKKDLGIIRNAGAAISELYEKRIRELSKGQNPLSGALQKSSGDITEATELGDAIN